jgi:hypothetical protein
MTKENISCFRITPDIVFSMRGDIAFLKSSSHDHYFLNITGYIREYFKKKSDIGTRTSN